MEALELLLGLGAAGSERGWEPLGSEAGAGVAGSGIALGGGSGMPGRGGSGKPGAGGVCVSFFLPLRRPMWFTSKQLDAD